MSWQFCPVPNPLRELWRTTHAVVSSEKTRCHDQTQRIPPLPGSINLTEPQAHIVQTVNLTSNRRQAVCAHPVNMTQIWLPRRLVLRGVLCNIRRCGGLMDDDG